MKNSTNRVFWRTGGLAVGFVIVLSAGPPVRLSAQGVLDQFSYDQLRPSGLQIDLGALGSSDLRGAIVGGVRLDYGQIAPRVRVLLGLSYFRSQFDNKARTRFEQRLLTLVNDPNGGATIQIGRIFWSDLTGDLDLQYVMPQGPTVTAYMGAGVGVHLRNGSGTAIDGTFVEDALDDIAAAFNLSVGAEFRLAPHWRVTMEGRGVISSGLSTVSARTGVMFRFRARE